MRDDPARLRFEIQARDGDARAGLIHPATARSQTPAFIPLATKGSVRGLSAAEVAALGYEMVLGNTFHLHLAPGEERIAARGGLHRFMGWERAIITDSGGFQVFSLAHGGVADEIKGRRGNAAGGAKVEISEDGVAFRSLLDGSDRFLGPEDSMRIQAALGSDIALDLRRVHALSTPTATTRPAPPSAPIAGSAAASTGTSGRARPRQAVFGIVQGGIHEDLRRQSAEADSPRRRSTGSRSAAPWAAKGGDARRPRLHGAPPPVEAPRHLLGIGEIDDLLFGIGIGIDLFDCAIPTRLARHGVALAARARTAASGST